MNRGKKNGSYDFLPIIKISKTAVSLQLLIIPVSIAVVIILGEPPQNALEAFEMMKTNQILGLIRDDLYNIIMITLYFLSFSGLFLILRKNNFTLSFYATLFAFAAVVLALSSHSGFSLIHLSRLYWEAGDEQSRIRLLAAGESIISQNLWNGSAGYFAGIFLQGSGIILSISMIGSKDFTKLTIFSGIMANGLDLIQHLIHPFLPAVSQLIIMVMGPFYILWFAMLIHNLNSYIKKQQEEVLNEGVR